MAHITINDLPQRDDLDREAMRSIAGGAVGGRRPALPATAKPGTVRVVDFPPGFEGATPGAVVAGRTTG